MNTLRRFLTSSDLAFLLLLAGIRFVIYLFLNQRYGFHRDALAFLDNGMNLSWGYVAYPPLTPLIGRIGLELFGLSLVGIKAFSALSQCIGMVLAGLIAKELGGNRKAQTVTAIAVAISPMSLLMGNLFQYISFDYLWWVFIAYCMVRLLRSENPRWWLAIGLGIGLGMMTKYTMAFFVAGIVASVLLTQSRGYLRSPWLWGGVGLSLLIFLPNLIWQIQHDFISLDFLNSIHARDVQIGRADGFLTQQLYVSANPFTLPLWVAGLYYFFFTAQGARYRAIGWMYVVPLFLFWFAEGRFYYMAPAYPMLIAGGAVWGEQWLTRLSERAARTSWRVVYGCLIVGAIIGAVLMLPLGPVNSTTWTIANEVHDNFAEQVGWEGLAETVTEIYEQELPEVDSLGIVAANVGEAAALNLYGGPNGLPSVISPSNSYWLRTYPDSPPAAVIMVGFAPDEVAVYFVECEVVGRVENSFGIENEASKFNPDILLCRENRKPWPEMWQEVQTFG